MSSKHRKLFLDCLKPALLDALGFTAIAVYFYFKVGFFEAFIVAFIGFRISLLTYSIEFNFISIKIILDSLDIIFATVYGKIKDKEWK